MQYLKQCIFIGLFFQLVYFNVEAQDTFVDGYIVNSVNDTLIGKVQKQEDYYKNSFLVVFQDESGDIKKYTPKEVKAYKRGSELFIKQESLRNKSLKGNYKHGCFMKVLLDDETVQVYRFDFLCKVGFYDKRSLWSQDGYVESPSYFVKSPNEKERVYVSDFMKLMTYYFADKKELSTKVRKANKLIH